MVSLKKKKRVTCRRKRFDFQAQHCDFPIVRFNNFLRALKLTQFFEKQ